MNVNIPQTMRAIVLTMHGGEPKVMEIPVPPPGKGEVLVKMYASPVNPSDLAFLSGSYGLKKEYPVVPGFEGSGIVVAAGRGVLPKLWLGKNVSCAASAKYNGCWAEYMVTQAGLCVPFPKSIPAKQAAMMFVNPMTAVAFFDIYKKTVGKAKEKHGIINTAAASALGRMIIRLGKRKGIPVISVVRRDEQAEMLKNEGAEYVLNSNSQNFEEELKELANRVNATIIFDAVCGKLSGQLLKAAPKGSRLYIYGRLSGEPLDVDVANLMFSGNEIHGFWLNNWLHDKSMFQKLVNTRKIQSLLNNELRTNIQKEFSIDKVSEAVETYRNNMSLGKVLLRF